MISLWLLGGFLFTSPVRWICGSDCESPVFVVTASGVCTIDDAQFYSSSRQGRDTLLEVRQDSHVAKILPVAIDTWSSDSRGTIGVCIFDEKIMVLDLCKDELQSVMGPGQGERFVEVHMSPDGRSVAVLVELDREEWTSTKSQWRVLDISSGRWSNVDPSLRTFPNVFIAWLPDNNEMLFRNDHSAATLRVRVNGHIMRREQSIPPSGLYLRSVAFNPDGTYLALTCEDADGEGHFCCLKRTERGYDSVLEIADGVSDPDDLSWAPRDARVLVRNRTSSRIIFRLFTPGAIMSDSLFSVPRIMGEDAKAVWSPDGKHVLWFQGDSLGIVHVPDSLLSRRY